MKTIKERIGLEATDYSCGFDHAYNAVEHGASFAIKAVIEMLEDRVAMFKRSKDKTDNIDSQISLGCKIRAINEIINLLKSEA